MQRNLLLLRIGVTVVTALIVVGVAVWAVGMIHPAAASSGSGVGDGVHPVEITVSNGRVTFETCKGTCTATDISPASAGPVRPWQTKGNPLEIQGQTIVLLDKGIQTSLVDYTGKPQNYLGMAAAICLNYTSADVAAAGGDPKRLRVAYWDPNIKDVNVKDWTVTQGRWYALKTTYTFQGAYGHKNPNEACALLRLPAAFALVVVDPGN